MNERSIDAKGLSTRSSLKAPLLLRFCNAVGLLVQEPLRQLHASMCCDVEHVGDGITPSSLHPLVEFIGRTLAALQELQDLLQGEDAVGGKAVLCKLLEGREDLVLCAKFAGSALRSLAADAGSQGVGARLKSLQEGLAETLDGVRLQWRREDARRHEIEAEATSQRAEEMAELRLELAEARGRAEALAEQAAEVADKKQLDNVFSEVSRLAQNADSVRQLSELWASEAAQRERELVALRERADTATAEARCAEEGAGAVRSCLVTEQRQLEAMHEYALRELSEEFAQERRERASLCASLSMQLHEARETISSRDQAIDCLRRSLSAEVERTCPAPHPRPPTPKGHGSGPIPSVLAPVARSRSHAEPTLVPPFPVTGAVDARDSSASVCRVSTESTAFASHVAPQPLPSQVFEAARSAWEATTPALESAAERPRIPSDLDYSLGSCSLRSVCAGAWGNSGTDTPSTAATGASSGKTPVQAGSGRGDRAGGVQRPWEFPPQEFLALWRRSRTSVLPGGVGNAAVLGSETPPRHVSHAQEIDAPLLAETLRITTSFQ